MKEGHIASYISNLRKEPERANYAHCSDYIYRQDLEDIMSHPNCKLRTFIYHKYSILWSVIKWIMQSYKHNQILSFYFYIM